MLHQLRAQQRYLGAKFIKTQYCGKYDQAAPITLRDPTWLHNGGMVRSSLLIVLTALSSFASHSVAQTPQRVPFEVATVRLMGQA
jgi:hypothetical protein